MPKAKATSLRTGRKAAKDAPAEPRTPAVAAGEVVLLPLGDIDCEDKTFMFRAAIRVGDLQKSLQQDGQQIPIIVRRGQGKKKYQIISGFRRTKAAVRLGWPHIAAIVRNGLSDDEAFRASVLENTARKTYSDIDRANIIAAYRQRKHAGDEVAKLMGLSDRQVRNLLSLLELPETVQAAIDDPNQHFSTTHALTLKKLRGAHPKPNFGKWVSAVNEEELSVSQLKRRVTADHKGEKAPAFDTVFQAKGTDWRKGVVRFAPVKVAIAELGEAEKKKLREELESLLERLA